MMTMQLKDPAMRMPSLATEQMTPPQRAAADELTAGPRKGVKGPFIALLRSPELLARAQKVGEFLRFQSSLSPRVSEFATLIVARAWSQQFEWFTHVPLALKAGTAQATIDALREGRRPESMDDEETLVHAFTTELLQQHGASETTYRRAVERLGEHGVVELTSLIGYFVMVSMVLNVTHTPEEPNPAVVPLEPFPR
jgi:4-carboxymuconolactone decarboxylase